MKKIFTLLFAAVIAFSFKSAGQTTTTCNLTAYFAFHADSVQSNKIHFTNYSTPFESGDSIRWTFGDGSYSADVNPTHIYQQPGIYNVCIRVQKKNITGASTCVKEFCKKIIVLSDCKLEANFSTRLDSVNHKVFFTNTSTPLNIITNVQWNFGDGTTSDEKNPDHTYAHSGTYNVCLKITSGTTCYKEICKTIEINATEISCTDISKFTSTRSTVNCLEFKFAPVTQNPNWKYVWSFGDGTGSNEMIPAGHVYPRSGDYTVYLTVFRSSACTSTSHVVAETGACFSCSNIWVKYEYTSAASASNTFYFHTSSNYQILSQSWTITKLSVSNATAVTLSQRNPVYVFNEPGDYRVCLHAVTAGQCVKEYCEVIHVKAPNTECTLQLYPNPSHNQVSASIQLTEPQMIHVYIYNSLNILVKQKEQQGYNGNNIVTTNIETLVPGWYTIKVIYGNRVCYAKFQKI